MVAGKLPVFGSYVCAAVVRLNQTIVSGSTHAVRCAAFEGLTRIRSGDGSAASERTRFLGLAHSPPNIAKLKTPEGPVPLQPLAGVVDECRAAAEHFPDSTLLAGEAATAAAYTDRASEHDIIHVALRRPMTSSSLPE